MFAVIVVLLVAVGVEYFGENKFRMKKTYDAKPITSKASLGNITTSITGSGTISLEY